MAFVLNQDKTPLNPCHNGKARWLLDNGYASIYKYHPFTIRLKKQVDNPNLKDYTLKIDPGSKATGLAINFGSEVVFLVDLHHRVNAIQKRLDQRSDYRGRRRSQLKYREKRFDNRKRSENWLPPSIDSIVDNIKTWVKRLKKLCPIDKVIMEFNRFDPHKMQKPDIEGIEYQEGSLQGYNIKEYLLYKHGHNCQYCKEVKKDKEGNEKVITYSGDDILEVEHKVPQSRGGSNKLSNLTLSCRTCNKDKDNRTLEEWLTDLEDKDFRRKLPRLRYNNVKEILNSEDNPSFKGAAHVNSYRYKLLDKLKEVHDKVNTSTGAKTKYNRYQLTNLSKTHHFDALCVGEVPDKFDFSIAQRPLKIKATGRGTRQRVKVDKYGFPKDKLKTTEVEGFRTGDIVKAEVPESYKSSGVYFGRVAIRDNGYFRVDCFNGESKDSVPFKCLTLLQRGSGYKYSFKDLAI